MEAGMERRGWVDRAPEKKSGQEEAVENEESRRVVVRRHFLNLTEVPSTHVSVSVCFFEAELSYFAGSHSSKSKNARCLQQQGLCCEMVTVEQTWDPNG